MEMLSSCEGEVEQRFWSIDPLADAPNQVNKSPYAFAWNNPIYLIDPDGRMPQACCNGIKEFFFDLGTRLSIISANHPRNNPNASPVRIQDLPSSTSTGPTKNITGNFFGDAAFKLLGGETFSKALDGDPKAQFRVISGAIVSTVPGGRGNPVDEAAGASLSKVFRVQGGDIPNASKQRLVFDGQGNLSISGDDMLFVTFDDQARAVQFLNKRGDNAELISFDISSQFADKVRNNAVPQRLGRLNPGAPQQVDQTVTNNSFGIPKEYFNEFLNSIDQSSIQRTAQ